jgi:hypothetical protein
MGVGNLTRKAAALGVIAAALGAAACGEVARTGRSPAFVVIERLEGASGATPNAFSTVVSSDVQTLVRQTIDGVETRVPTIYGDPGRISARIGLKIPGPADSPLTPSSLNAISLYRYRVVYQRSDGRNTQGVDVPYAFDGGMTMTILPEETTIGFFDLVRVIAKSESPLVRMVGNGGAQAVATIAEVTFYGRDQAGNEVTVSGTISVTFADFGDPN